jgi:hypothetical protein
MADMMRRERFCALAEAYGGDLARWPLREQAAAAALAALNPDLRGRLQAAAELDGLLDAWEAPIPSLRLQAGVARALAAGAPAARRPARMRLWLSGAGLAAAGLVGVLCGTAVSSAAAQEARDQALLSAATADGVEAFAGAGEGTRAGVAAPSPRL